MPEQLSAGIDSPRGADSSLQDKEGKTALDYARENSHEEVVSHLKKIS